MRIQSLMSGVISCFPGGNDYLFKRIKDSKRNVTTINARYCYSVWLRHLVLANRHGAARGVPATIAELGPGNSLGTGLAALISGAKQYYAFDLVPHAVTDDNLTTFNELVQLFEERADIPDSSEFPKIHASLDDYRFPSEILCEDTLKIALDKERLAGIKSALSGSNVNCQSDSVISYIVPWDDQDQISPGTIDMIFSMSVLEHIDELEPTYKTIYRWLKDGGFMSHEIDFKCHGHAAKWNGHWGYSDLVWKIIKGKRPYLINRIPHSGHLDIIKECGFNIVTDLPKLDYDGLGREELASKFRYFSDSDICTHNTYIIGMKPNPEL